MLKLPGFFALARLVAVLLLLCTAVAATPAGAAAAEPAPPEATLEFQFRHIFIFRTTFSGLTPAVRARRAHERINRLTPAQMLQPIVLLSGTIEGDTGVALRSGDIVLFSVLTGDLDPDEKLTLQQAAAQAQARLAEAMRIAGEKRLPMTILKEVAWAALATLVAFSLVWLTWRATRLLVARLQVVIDRDNATPALRLARHIWLLVQRMSQLLMVFLWLGFGYAWLTFVLSTFPTTEPLGSKLGNFLVDLAQGLGRGIVSAIPGLVTVLLILFLTKAINDVITNFFRNVDAGRIQVPGIHRETISATRRIITILVWCFGVAVAYPYIPLSNSDAFKGLSVMLGFMLTLGSAGIVTQLMSGLVLVYSRALSVGDFVDINGTTGVVSEVGVLSTKIVDMRNEEVTIPNAVLIGNPIRNYSRLTGDRGALVSTKVTIGYDAPWRQVYAMLVAAAEQTAGLRRTPTPFVYQRGLADFYVEYELFAYMDQPLNRVSVLSELHGHIQDQFNLHGVQMMSPHFMLQPRNNVLVPRDQWHAAPAVPPAAGDPAVGSSRSEA